MSLILDVNTWVFPMELGDKFRLMLCTSLREDGAPDEGTYTPLDSGPSRADTFEYVCYGKVYRLDAEEGPGDTL